MSNAQKHSHIKAIADSKRNSIEDFISKAFQDGQISDDEYKMVLCELEKYNDLKDKTHTKQSGLSEAEKEEVNRRRKSMGTKYHSKKKKKKSQAKLYVIH